jgi:hypothetical protein
MDQDCQNRGAGEELPGKWSGDLCCHSCLGSYEVYPPGRVPVISLMIVESGGSITESGGEAWMA